MNPLFKVINRAFVVEFYKANIGFLGIVFFLCFGFIKSDDHIALFPYILSSPFVISIMFGVWALYHLKVSQFFVYAILKKENGILRSLSLLPHNQQFTLLYSAHWQMLTPVWGYALFMSIYGLMMGYVWAVLVIWSYLLLLPTTVIWYYKRTFKNPHSSSIVQKYSLRINPKIVRRPFTFFLEYLVRENGLTLLITKVFSSLVVIGFCRLYPTDDYDERLLSLMGSVIATLHLGMVWQYYSFEHITFPLVRNLPISSFRRITQTILVFAILLLPELLVFCRNMPNDVSFLYISRWFLFVLGIVLILYTRFLQKYFLPENIIKPALYFFIINFFVIMYKLPIGTIGTLFLLFSAYFVNKNYYKSSFLK